MSGELVVSDVVEGKLPDLVVLSLGAGVQSTTLALLAAEEVLPRPDVAIFADTGWEPRGVYEHLERLEAVLPFPVLRVSRGNLRTDMLDPERRFASLPVFVMNPDGSDGMGRRQCTSEYKLTPIRRKVRELLGAKPPEYRTVPRGKVAEQWIGFSTDEVHRANRVKDSDGVQYLSTRYPLLELDMSRKDCERWLQARGWGASTVKSACIGCPYHGNRAWRELRDQRPDEWADAVAFDAAIRDGQRAGFVGEQYLHRSRLPLDQAPIDRVTRNEWRDRQVDLLDLVADELAEDGDPDGCSPYGCRSGEPVVE